MRNFRGEQDNTVSNSVHLYAFTDQDPQREAPGMVCPVPELRFQPCSLHRRIAGNTGWVAHGRAAPTRSKRRQDGDGVIVGIIGNELVGPFKVEDCVKIDSVGYTQFLEKNLMPWTKKKSVAFKKKMIFMQDNAPSHASKFTREWLAKKSIKEDHLMTWPPTSQPQPYRELLVTAEEGTLC